MRYQHYFSAGDHSNWLELEVTLGSNEALISRDLNNFNKFVRSFDQAQKDKFKEVTEIEITDSSDFTITNRMTLQSLMIKKFIDGSGLSVIEEARVSLGNNEKEIYLKLLEDLIRNENYPEDIYVYATYRGRGTPTTWLNINNEYSSEDIKSALENKVSKIVRSINYHLPLSRKLVLKKEVNGLVIYLLKKPTNARVQRAENKNVEVPAASYTLLVLDYTNRKIGIVSGSKREVQIVQRYLRHKTFKDALAPARNDHVFDGEQLLKKILKPDNPDMLNLQSIELKSTPYSENPYLKLKVEGNKSIDEAIETLNLLEGTSVSELKKAEFSIPTGRTGASKKIGIYSYGDEWNRICLNTSTRNITTLTEDQFLNQIKTRLGGLDIKTSKFIINDLNLKFIINKLISGKKISTNPPIPEEAEKAVIELTKKKFIINQKPTIKRKCWNCYTVSWDHWECPNCGRTEMRIVNEGIRIIPSEKPIIKAITKIPEPTGSFILKYSPRKQRNRHKKSVVAFYNTSKKITTFIVLISNNIDVKYVSSLSSEGFGVVSIVDPKLKGKEDEIENAGSTVVSLTDVLVYLLDSNETNQLTEAIKIQEEKMLEKIFSNFRSSITKIKAKSNYDEAQYEVDIRNIIQAIVPDVIRLGTESIGQSVPDGYCRYGSNGVRSLTHGKRLFGWDAKYSQTASYSLYNRDVSKQKKYIDWLNNPKGQASQFGNLGIYAIVANFSNPRRLNTALTKIARYSNLKRGTRIALIDDELLVKIGEWTLSNWQQVIDNNSVIADEVFHWFRRKQRRQPYTISRASDWRWLEPKLNKHLTH